MCCLFSSPSSSRSGSALRSTHNQRRRPRRIKNSFSLTVNSSSFYCRYKYTIRSIVCEASCHLVTRLLGHSVTQLLGRLVTRSLRHSVTRSLGHLITCSLSHSFTQSLSHLVTRSLSHSVTQSLSHSVTQSHGLLVTR